MSNRLVRMLWLVVAISMLVGAVAFGFLAGRRYPFAFLDPYLPKPKGFFQWTTLAPAPLPRYEAAVAEVDGSVYVFGGFHNDATQATRTVHVYEMKANRWIARGEMPEPFTHANAARIGNSVWFAGGFVGDHPAPTTNHVWRYDVPSDTWHAGPPLPEERGAGALVALDGMLHFFGGYKSDRTTDADDHWVLNPAGNGLTEGWARRMPMPVPRGHLTGIALNGSVYAIGGCVGHDPTMIDVSYVHRYDPRADQWVEVASLPNPRSHLEPSTFVRDGRIVISGGRDITRQEWNLSDIIEYDPASDAWLTLGNLPKALLAPSVAWRDGRLFVATGAQEGNKTKTNEAWSGTPTQGWFPGPSMPVRLGEVAGGIIRGRLYVVGDGHPGMVALNLGTDAWEPPQRFPFRPFDGHHHAAEVIGEKLYLIGGLGRAMGRVQIYDPVRNEWRLGTDMPFAAGSSASAVIDRQVYVAGGIIGTRTTTQAARLDVASGVWTAVAPMPLARNHAASGTDGRRFYIFGGRGPGSGDANVVANGYDEVQIYDPASDKWSVSGAGPQSPARLPQARGGMGKAVYLRGKFYVIGGETEDGAGATRSGVYSRVDVYDPATNTWSTTTPLPTARHGIFPLSVADRILVAGGGVKAALSASDTFEIYHAGGSAETDNASNSAHP